MFVKFLNPHSNISYQGRNGAGYCKGMVIVRHDYETLSSKVALQPVNSKDRGANCAIDIPVEDVPWVAAAILEAASPGDNLMRQAREALNHALNRLNMLPHDYSETDFNLIEDTLIRIVRIIGPGENIPAFITQKAADLNKKEEEEGLEKGYL